jgi:tetratricopeptide (TPR) repeat protein
MMADCERALGRLDRALALVREASAANLDRATQIELRIVESGIRRDQGLSDAAVLALQVPELTRGRLRPWSARLFYAYADALLAAGRVDEARDGFARAAAADTEDETDAADRLDELDGIEFDDLEDPDLEDDDLPGVDLETDALEADALEDDDPDDHDEEDGDPKDVDLAAGDLEAGDLHDRSVEDDDLDEDDLEAAPLDEDHLDDESTTASHPR